MGESPCARSRPGDFVWGLILFTGALGRGTRPTPHHTASNAVS